MAKFLDGTLRLAGSRFDNVLATKLTVAPPASYGWYGAS